MRRSSRSKRSLRTSESKPREFQELYPMYVLPAARVLTLERLPTHEEIFSELKEWQEDMHTLFVSQTWLTDGHPDNQANIKLKLLQAFLQNATHGNGKSIHPSWELEMVWGKKLQITPEQMRSIGWVWFE